MFQGGFYVFTLLDSYAAGYSILFAVFFETIAIAWFYGTDRFSKDIQMMLGFKPGIYWTLCWKFFAPIFIMASAKNCYLIMSLCFNLAVFTLKSPAKLYCIVLYFIQPEKPWGYTYNHKKFFCKLYTVSNSI